MSSYQRNAILVTLLCSAGIFFLSVIGFDRAPGSVGLRTSGPGLSQAIRNDLNAGANIEKGVASAEVKRQHAQAGDKTLEIQLDEARRLVAGNQTYFDYFSQFDSALNYLKRFVATVHKAFTDASNKKTALNQIERKMGASDFVDVKNNILDTYLKVLNEVRETEPSDRWKGTVSKTVIGMLTGANKTAFKQYQDLIKSRGGDLDFFSKEDVAKILRDNNITTTMQVMSLLQELEKYLYRMERRKIISYPTARRDTRHFIKMIHELYPDLLTLRDAEQIDNLGNVPLAYLVNYAQGLLMVINNMATELNELKRKY